MKKEEKTTIAKQAQEVRDGGAVLCRLLEEGDLTALKYFNFQRVMVALQSLARARDEMGLGKVATAKAHKKEKTKVEPQQMEIPDPERNGEAKIPSFS